MRLEQSVRDWDCEGADIPFYVHFSKGLNLWVFISRKNNEISYNLKVRYRRRYYSFAILFSHTIGVFRVLFWRTSVITSSLPYFPRRACCPPRFNFIAMPALCQTCTEWLLWDFSYSTRKERHVYISNYYFISLFKLFRIPILCIRMLESTHNFYSFSELGTSIF